MRTATLQSQTKFLESVVPLLGKYIYEHLSTLASVRLRQNFALVCISKYCLAYQYGKHCSNVQIDGYCRSVLGKQASNAILPRHLGYMCGMFTSVRHDRKVYILFKLNAVN